MQSRSCCDVHRHHLSLGPAQRRNEVIHRERVAHIRSSYAMSSHFFRIKPGSQGKFRLAQNLGRLNSFHCLKFGLHNPDQIVRDVIRGQILAVETYNHGTDVLAGGDSDHRLL